MSRVMRITRHMNRVMRITRTLCQRYVLNSHIKKNTKKNTKHAALATQPERQVEKKTYTYNTDS